jgi:hypothetical protein
MRLEKSESTTVLVRFDDQWQIGIEIERVITTGKAVVYLPGAPDHWVGAVAIVSDDRITRLDLTQLATLSIFKNLGKNTSSLLDALPDDREPS